MELTLSTNDLEQLLSMNDQHMRIAIQSMLDGAREVADLQPAIWRKTDFLKFTNIPIARVHVVARDNVVAYDNINPVVAYDNIVAYDNMKTDTNTIEGSEHYQKDAGLGNLTQVCTISCTTPESDEIDEGVTVEPTSNGGLSVRLGKEKFFISPRVFSQAVARLNLSRETLITETENMAMWYHGKGIKRESWVATWQQWMARTAKRASTVPITSEEAASLPYNHPKRGRVAVL